MKKNMITKEQAKRLAEVAIALMDGKTVTRKSAFNKSESVDVVHDDELSAAQEYTIHEPPPEPKYRPWTLEEAIDNIGRVVMPCHGTEAYLLVGTLKGSTSPLVLLGGFEESMDVSELLDGWQFLDGTPCGVRE
jgi:hypothetical protein